MSNQEDKNALFNSFNATALEKESIACLLVLNQLFENQTFKDKYPISSSLNFSPRDCAKS